MRMGGHHDGGTEAMQKCEGLYLMGEPLLLLMQGLLLMVKQFKFDLTVDVCCKSLLNA